MKKYIFLGLFLFLPNLCLANTTWYISWSSGSDISGSGSAGLPYHTSTKTFTVGGNSDVYILFGSTSFGNISNPPSGVSTAPTIVKADNDGHVIDGGMVRSGLVIGDQSVTRNYIHIEGFLFKNSSNSIPGAVQSPDGTSEVNETSNVVIMRCGFVGSTQNTQSGFTFARVRNCLAQDVWVTGHGRYTFLNYGNRDIRLNRITLRWDGKGIQNIPTDPTFSMSVYNVKYSTFENIIILDSSATLLTPGDDAGGLYLPSNSNPSTALYTESSYNNFYNIIILNEGIGTGILSEGNSLGTGMNHRNYFENVVIWAGKGTGVSVNKFSSNTWFNHCTVSSSAGGGFYSGTGGNVFSSSATNCWVSSSTTDGFNNTWGSNYCNVFGNGTNYNSASAGQQSISSATQIVYITTNVSGNANSGLASDGLAIGADVTKEYSQGVLTTVNRFPIPYQARIRTEMCDGVTRGFCNSSYATISDYIWGWLGTSCPSGVCQTVVSNFTANFQGLQAMTGVRIQ